MQRMSISAVVIVVIACFLFYGCGAPNETTVDAPNPPADSGNGQDGHGHSHEGHNHHGDHGQADMDKMKAELAKLPPEDAASAEKQHFCPVSGETLGAMGAPQKVDVEGQEIWICCEHCKDKLLEKPDEYLAKLQKD